MSLIFDTYLIADEYFIAQNCSFIF